MLQLARAAMKDNEDRTKFYLLFANQSDTDILLRDELDALKDANSGFFDVWYTVDKSPASGWHYSTGFISADMIKDHLPPPSPDTCILMCGPPPMITNACEPALDKLGYDKATRFAY